jgi:phage terminase small subunit
MPPQTRDHILGAQRKAKFIELMAEAEKLAKKAGSQRPVPTDYVERAGWDRRRAAPVARKLMNDQAVVEEIYRKAGIPRPRAASAGPKGRGRPKASILPDSDTTAAVAAAKAAADAQRALDDDVAKITPLAVLLDWWTIHKTNVTELVELRRCSCRHCWGRNFLYNRTPEEQRKRKLEFEYERRKIEEANAAKGLRSGQPGAQRVPKFSLEGGDTYNPNTEPHPACPECFGNGVATPHFHDTRTMSKGAKRLYAGIKVTGSGGTEMLLRNQDRALELIAKHLGMLIERKETGKPGEFDNLTPEEAEQKLIDELVSGGVPEEVARAFVARKQGG